MGEPGRGHHLVEVLDFGSGTTRSMFLAASAGSTPRFAISTTGAGGEQRINATNTAMTLTPASPGPL